jgi:hypothetical protein
MYPAAAYTIPQVQTALPDSNLTKTTVSSIIILIGVCYVGYAIYLGIHLQIFIGNLDPNATEEELRQICVQFGDLIRVKIPVGKGCGFVEFASM